MRQRLGSGPQTALTLVQLARQRPETLTDRILIDHDQAVLHNAHYSSTLFIYDSLDAFATPDGRARFHPVSHRAAAEEPDEEFPLYLTTGRTLMHYQSGTQTMRVDELRSSEPDAFVELHPVLARRFAIEDADLLRLHTRRGTACGRARLTPDIRPETLFMPFHWGGTGRANLLTNPALDPESKMPEFKVCAVRLEPVETGERA